MAKTINTSSDIPVDSPQKHYYFHPVCTPHVHLMSASPMKQSATDERIAVVGMAVKYTGCNNKEEFWSTLMNQGRPQSAIRAKRLGSDRRDIHLDPRRSKFADTFCNDTYGTTMPAHDFKCPIWVLILPTATCCVGVPASRNTFFKADNSI